MNSRRRQETADGTLDQWFTKSEHLHHYAAVILKHIDRAKPFIDSSCGTGELGKILSAAGIEVQMFDLDLTSLLPDCPPVQQKDWFEVKKLDIGEFCMGFNPPFGHKGKIARQFVEHGVALGATLVCAILPPIMGYKGRQWTPEDFVELHRELVPEKAFTCKGKTVSANANFVIFKKAPAEFKKQREAWDLEDARPLPEGWHIERLSRRLGTNDRQAVDALPKNEDELVLRTSLAAAGRSAIVWTRDDVGGGEGGGKYSRITSEGKTHALPPLDTLGVSQHCIVGVSKRYRGDKRMEFLQRVGPLFTKIRRRAGNKGGVNISDIRKVIFEITS